MNSVGVWIASSQVLLLTNSILAFGLLVLFFSTGWFFSDLYRLMQTVNFTGESYVIVAPFMLFGALIFYFLISINALWLKLLSVVSKVPVAYSSRPLASLIARSRLLAISNACVVLPLMVNFFTMGIAQAPLDERIFTTVGILSMAGIGLFLIPLLVPLGWLLLGVLLFDYFVSSCVALGQMAARKETELPSSLQRINASSPCAVVGSKVTPEISTQVIFKYLIPVLLLVISLLLIQNIFSEPFLSDKVHGSLVLLAALWCVYVTAQKLFKRHSFWKALLYLVLVIPVWFVGLAVVVGIVAWLFR